MNRLREFISLAMTNAAQLFWIVFTFSVIALLIVFLFLPALWVLFVPNPSPRHFIGAGVCAVAWFILVITFLEWKGWV